MRNLMSTCRCFCMLSLVVLPSLVEADVTTYDWMQISGSTQEDGVHLLTDYVPKSNTVIKARYSTSSDASSNNNQFLFCSRLKAKAETSALHFSYAPNVSGKFRFDYYGTYYSASSMCSANVNYELVVSAGRVVVSNMATGVATSLGNGLLSFSPAYKMSLLQSYQYESNAYASWFNSFHGKFYYLQIYDIEDGEEVLKHHFVPCEDNGVVKLCDLADSGSTYTLTTTGSGVGLSVGNDYRYIVSGYPVADESHAFTTSAMSLDARYRTWFETMAIALRSDKFSGFRLFVR